MLKTRILRPDEVVFRLDVAPEDEPLDGNLCAHEEDHECSEWTRKQLEQGNVWAWCRVTVTASWRGLVGRDSLGCCNYKSQEDFMQEGGYYQDMRYEALADLQAQIDAVVDGLNNGAHSPSEHRSTEDV